jgi:folate-dependent phosphoribosylglycinamide formyltransferase PurN
MSKNRAIILATEGLTTDLLYQGISDEIDIAAVIIEKRESSAQKIKRRVKKIGVFKTMGQVLFLILIQPLIPKRKSRIHEIISHAQIDSLPIPKNLIKSVENIHDQSVINAIQELQPDLILINGTRILKKDLLEKISCPILNIHVGITPKYRGVHGGYWALRNQEPELFGVTLHKVDSGIDTGAIIAQRSIKISNLDNFNTYPILQYVEGILLLKKYLNQEELKNNPLTKETALWYHPTLWQYVFGKA